MIIKAHLDERERTVIAAALGELSSIRLDAVARWRVLQLESMLMEKEPETEAALDEP